MGKKQAVILSVILTMASKSDTIRRICRRPLSKNSKRKMTLYFSVAV
jgi:hypothetical protein